MKKYPKIKRLGDSVNDGILDEGRLLVQEKLDGANFRFTYDRESERLVFGSRNVEYWNDGNQEITKRDRRRFKINSYLNRFPFTKDRPTSRQNDVDKSFNHAIEYVKQNISMPDLKMTNDLHRNSITIFGEAMHPHTLDYDWDDVPSVIIFGMYSDELGWFMSYQLVETLGLPTAPVLYNGPAKDVPDDILEVPNSEFREGRAEGIVIKNIDTGQMAKVRSKEFREKKPSLKTSKSDDDGYNEDDSVVLAETYATEARIKKIIAKMRDEGYDIEMSMMEELWRRVFDDILEEEYETIFLGNHSINTKRFRSEVAGKTALVLQDILSRPSNSVLNDGLIE